MNTTMTENGTYSGDWGRLLLRLAIGGLMLMHGIGKLTSGIDPIINMTQGHGLPKVFAYGVYLGEVVAPLLVLVGWWTRPASLVIAFTMVMAIWMAHSNDVFTVTSKGWAIELPMLYLLGSLALASLGPGRLSISKGTGRLD